MNTMVPLSSQVPEIFPARTAEEATEAVARDVVAAFGALRRAEMMAETCSMEAVEQAKRALAAVTATERVRLEEACRPATHEDLAVSLAAMIGSIPHGHQAVAGQVYGTMMVGDVGAMEPSKGAVEAACRRLRTSSRYLPK